MKIRQFFAPLVQLFAPLFKSKVALVVLLITAALAAILTWLELKFR